MNNMKCLAIGQNRNHELEFGEFYHLATALILEPKLEYELFGKIPKGITSFLKFFGETPEPKDIKTYNKITYDSIGKTADIFKCYIERHNELSKVRAKFESIINNSLEDNQKYKINERIERLNLDTKSKKCFIWIRKGNYQPNRNISSIGLIQLKNVFDDLDIKPLFLGATIGTFKKEDNNLIEFYKDEPFRDCNIIEQLYLFKILIEKYNFLFSVGMKSGAMDGLAFAFNLKTFYFATNDSNDRMRKVSQVFTQLMHINLNGAKNDKFISFHDDDIRRLINKMKDCGIL